MESLLAVDRSVFLWLNNKWAHPYLDLFFSAITWLGNGWIIILMVALFFALKEPVYLRRHLLWLCAAMLLSGLCIVLLKKIAPRPRPLSDFAPLIEAGKVHVHVLGEHLRRRSFPSGHTQTAFAAATYLSFLVPRWALVFLSLAGAVGVSRIYMGVHFPLDVIVGGVIGVVFAWFVWSARKRFKKPYTPSQV